MLDLPRDDLHGATYEVTETGRLRRRD
jgi:hypothetical protein